MQSVSDELSALAFRIETLYNDNTISTATAFLYRHNQTEIFLVTNYHVLSGYNFETGETMHSQGALPNRIRANIPIAFNDGIQEGFNYRLLDLLIADEDRNVSWKIHKEYGSLVDVAVIHVVNDEEGKAWTINEAIQLPLFDDFRLRPGIDVFIIGFPLGKYVRNNLGLWKRGTIASEPENDVNGKPMILVDTATRQGMSGSPVIAQISGIWNPMGVVSKEGKPDKGTVIGTGRKFLGVYSGRLGQDEFRAQLGIVWKEHLIREIVEQGNPGHVE